jgi:hypothetical protein
MAQLPRGCVLLANPIGAPGFAIGGVYAFPGFPTMLQPMATYVPCQSHLGINHILDLRPISPLPATTISFFLRKKRDLVGAQGGS